jgi:hypothetical protein
MFFYEGSLNINSTFSNSSRGADAVQSLHHIIDISLSETNQWKKFQIRSIFIENRKVLSMTNHLVAKVYFEGDRSIKRKNMKNFKINCVTDVTNHQVDKDEKIY